jgi:hypothetical protein
MDEPIVEEYLNEDQRAQLETEVSEFCEAAASKRRPKEIQWALARRMVAGDQWVKQSPNPTVSGQLLDNVVLPGRMEKWKIVANRLLPGMSTRIAHVLKNKPIGVVTPETQDEDDRNAARIADEVVEYDFRTLDYHNKNAVVGAPTQFATGNVFWHWYWDPLAGPEIDVPSYLTDETGEPVVEPIEIPDPLGAINPDGSPVMVPNPDPNAGHPILLETKRMPRGEPALEVVEPEELYLDPSAKTFGDCQGVVRQTLRPIDETRRLMEMAGVAPEMIEKIDKADSNSVYGGQITSAAKLSGYTNTEIASRCEVRVFWAKPNAQKGFPKGIRAVFVNRELFIAEPTPEGHDHIPFAHAIEIPLPGEVYGTSSVIQAMPIQKALNLVISRDEYRRTVQRPKPVADYEAGIDEGAWTNEDAEILFKNHGYSVDWLNPPAFESDPRAIERYVAFIDDLFGNVAILMGESDGEIRSGRQALVQGEYAGTALSGPARSIEHSVQAIGRGLLKLRKALTTEERDIQIVGKNRGIEILAFRGADLEGAGDYYVEPGSALPMSTAQKKQLIFEMIDRQMIDPMKARRLLPMPSDIDAENDEERLDRDRATEENLMFAELTPEDVQAATEQATMEDIDAQKVGLPPSPDPHMALLEQLSLDPRADFENNAVHLETHNRFRKTRAYRNIPKAIRALMDLHCDGHLPPMMGPPDGGPPGGGGDGKSPEQITPQGLVPGMPSRFASVGESADMAGDKAAGMPAMPPGPVDGNR